ncbi:uncharacterized protein F4822DRAFT_285401 [Hypoxylon trugodes]|uniref:uncharacterized protein n=1 Tax=Hypoxylon trugodes TaxID=326681 RepID=UPI00219665F9|nr:uncharacterized protein F4822DRAFT_285401 [Hypoxylon trugodes]KAI1387526.1 hypothetical protein F4822DRAFT_285401 [Hypoxylon trugodes]
MHALEITWLYKKDRGAQPPHFADPGNAQETLTATTITMQFTPSQLLRYAVEEKDRDAVRRLLQMNPSISLMREVRIVDAILDNPDPTILRILCNHQPVFVNFFFPYIHVAESFLTKACTKPPNKINSVIHVLLDNGAQVNMGRPPDGGALSAAIVCGQSLDIISKIINKGGIINLRTILEAIRLERADVIELLLNYGDVSPDVDANVERMTEEAVKTANEQIKRVVVAWAEKMKLLINYGKLRVE